MKRPFACVGQRIDTRAVLEEDEGAIVVAVLGGKVKGGQAPSWKMLCFNVSPGVAQHLHNRARGISSRVTRGGGVKWRFSSRSEVTDASHSGSEQSFRGGHMPPASGRMKEGYAPAGGNSFRLSFQQRAHKPSEAFLARPHQGTPGNILDLVRIGPRHEQIKRKRLIPFGDREVQGKGNIRPGCHERPRSIPVSAVCGELERRLRPKPRFDLDINVWLRACIQQTPHGLLTSARSGCVQQGAAILSPPARAPVRPGFEQFIDEVTLTRITGFGERPAEPFCPFFLFRCTAAHQLEDLLSEALNNFSVLDLLQSPREPRHSAAVIKKLVRLEGKKSGKGAEDVQWT